MHRFSDTELEVLLQDTESDQVERKQSFKGETLKKARQAVCAFANDLPNHNKAGILFVGACDDGRPSNEPISDHLLRSLADMKTDGNILPLPVLSVEKRVLNGADMAVVTVMPSDMPPVKYDGRIWIRTGPRRSIAYLCQQYSLRLVRPITICDTWVKRIPAVYREAVLGEASTTTVIKEDDPYCLATTKHYRSIVQMAQEHRKPMFSLTPADGALGSHAGAVQDAKKDFRRLAEVMAARINMPV